MRYRRSPDLNPEEWHRITAVFNAALARDPPDRAAFLDDACGDDAELHGQVNRLLAAHEAAGSFGEVPLAAFASGTSLADPAPDRIAGHAAPSTADEAASESDAGRTGRWSHPFAWLVLVAALMLAGTFGYAAWLIAVHGGPSPVFGWREMRAEGRWLVEAVAPAGPAAGVLQPGDRLLRVNGGQLFLRPGTGPYRRALAAGESYRLTIERGGERFDVVLVVGAGPRRLPIELTYFGVALFWCVIGLFIGLARPDRPVARLASAASVMTGVGFLSAVLPPGPPLFHPLHVVVGYHFWCRFPADRPTTGSWRWSLLLLYTVGAVPVALAWWMRGVRLAGDTQAVAELVNTYPVLFENRGMLVTSVFYACLGLMVAVGVRNYRRLASEGQHRRVRWVIFGSIVALTPQIVWSIAGIVLGQAAVAWMSTPANAFTALIPLVTAYAVVRHRVFDIRVVVRRGVQYLLARRVLQAVVVAPMIALVVTVARHRDLTIGQLVGETQAYLYWLGAAGLALRFRRPLQRGLDRRFFREEYDRERVVVGLLDDVRKVESVPELARVVGDRLASAIHPSTLYVWHRDPEELAVASSTDPLLTPPDVPAGTRWLRWLEERGEATLLPTPAEAGLSPADARWFSDRGVSLAVPIVDGADRLVAAFLLGAKKSEEPYAAGDMRLLNAIARQTGVVRENLRLRRRVDEEVRLKHDVLAKLDPGMPDLLRECPVCGRCFDSYVDHCPEDARPLVLSLPVARTIDGKYRLDRRIGSGGMGAVFEARDLRLERTVAVKVLLGRAFGQRAALHRFNREARATARLNHPNIVALYDYGPVEGEGAYLVMERLHGATLRDELERRGSLSPVRAADWFAPLLDGIAAAHAKGIVHRDLKPENVMCVRAGTDALVVKILDLGLAKLEPVDSPATATVTVEGTVMGTPTYMSPEQRAGRPVDHRTDIYAIGVMLVEALAGERPRPGDGREALAQLFPSLSRRVGASADQVRELEGVLRRCLAADPTERFASAGALRDELIPVLQTCSVSAG
jgi:eukaryotic-like serine/threonine-protein kinase